MNDGVLLLLALALVGCVYFMFHDRGHAQSNRSLSKGVAPRSEHSTHERPSERDALASARETPPVVDTASAVRTSLSGRVSDERGRALAGASVCVSDLNAECCVPRVCVQSSGTGAFTLPVAGAGAATLFASHPRYQPVARRVLVGDETALTLTLKDGGVAIRGRVLDAAGGPISEARVLATDARQRLLALGVSDDDGSFRLDVAPGTTEILARAEGYSEERRGVQAPRDGFEIRLVPASSVVGRVVAEGSGLGVGQVRVSARAEDPQFSFERATESLEGGTFRLDGLRSGRYWLTATAAHWRSEPQWVLLEVAQPSAPLEIVVSRAVQLSGVLQLGGAPCARGSVALRGPVNDVVMAGADGSVVVDGLTSGHYELSLVCQGAREQDALELGEQDNHRVWDLDPRISLTGVVLTERGTPVAEAQVNVEALDPAARGVVVDCTTDAQGEFSCAGLAPGEHDVEVVGTPPRSERVRVHLGSGPTPRLVLRTHEEGAIRVRVEGTEGINPATFSLLAKTSDGPPRQGQLSGDTFVFDPVPLGRYEIFTDADPTRTTQHVELLRDGQIAELSMSLPAQHRLSGHVIDDAGQALPDVWVRADREQNMAWAEPTEPVLTDADGAFSLSGLVPGRYTLNASGPRGDVRLRNVASDAAEVVVRLESYGSLSGTLQQRGGSSVPEFVVTFSRRGGDSRGEVSGSRGSWSLPWLAPGTYDLSAETAEGNVSRTVQLPPGEDVRVALILERLDELPTSSLTPHAALGSTESVSSARAEPANPAPAASGSD